MDVGKSAWCVERDGTFLERLNLKQPAAIGFVVQAAPRAGGALGAIGWVILGMEMVGSGRGSLLRFHQVIVGEGASFRR
jgi:hypothetical protein